MSPRFHGYNPTLRKLPKPHPTSANVSWWSLPEFQTSREAFQRRLVSHEIDRLNRSRFRGRGRCWDSGIPEPNVKR